MDHVAKKQLIADDVRHVLGNSRKERTLINQRFTHQISILTMVSQIVPCNKRVDKCAWHFCTFSYTTNSSGDQHSKVSEGHKSQISAHTCHTHFSPNIE
mmetsp:Transcript_1853/g.6581  ORF Transcript_1853/g.6581 Transcript_1853/m.6581 type:complete len:99 (-) Transcript_1853:1617-1913(-)